MNDDGFIPQRGTDVLDSPVAEIAVYPQALQETEGLEVAVDKLVQLDIGIDFRKCHIKNAILKANISHFML